MDARLRELERRGGITARHLARVGLARVIRWDGAGDGDVYEDENDEDYVYEDEDDN